MKAKTKLARRKTKPVKFVKIEAKPLTEEQINSFVQYYNKNKTIPGSKIPCTITGKLTTCVGPWMIKKVKEFGGIEKLLRKYVCRGAIKTEKESKKPKVKKSIRASKIEELRDEQKNWDIPKIDFTPSRPMNDGELSEASKTTCFRPDVYLDNDNYCDGCEFYDVCTNSLRRLADWNKTKKKSKK